jgi:hypothetical protein
MSPYLNGLNARWIRFFEGGNITRYIDVVRIQVGMVFAESYT